MLLEFKCRGILEKRHVEMSSLQTTIAFEGLMRSYKQAGIKRVDTQYTLYTEQAADQYTFR